MKGHKYSMGGTHGKIVADMRRHRAKGGEVEGNPKTGDDDAEKDLKDKPTRRLNSKINDEAEATKAKRGGAMKKDMGKMDGKKCRANGGRLPRASGGGCESNPFTSASKGTPAVGRGGAEGVEKMTMGRD